MSSIIHALGLKDTTDLKFPIGLYTTKALLRGESPFAVITTKKGKTTLRAGSIHDNILCKIVVD